MKLFKKAKKGFTLVELIVVIAIVAILAAVSVAGYYGFIESAKQSRADQEAAQVKLVIQAACTPKSAKEYGKYTMKHSFVWGSGKVSVSNAETVDVLGDLQGMLAYNGVEVVTTFDTTAKASLTFHGLEEGANKDYVTPTTEADGWFAKITYQSAEGKTSVIDFTK